MEQKKKSTEAQKRASKKYYLAHKEYYYKKSAENTSQVRKNKKIYENKLNIIRTYLLDKTYLDESSIKELMVIIDE